MNSWRFNDLKSTKNLTAHNKAFFQNNYDGKDIVQLI